MPFFKDSDKQAISERLAGLSRKVKLVFATQEFECQFCSQTRELYEEFVELSDKLELQVLDLVADKELAEKYHLSAVPGLNVVAVDDEGKEHDYGVLFYGIPAGYEFISLLDAVRRVSSGDSELMPINRAKLKSIDKPLDLQVFVTPTCPYCPRAVELGHQMAIENPNITSAMVEATEFPHLAQKYMVRGVPKTIFTDEVTLEGALPEDAFIDAARQAAGLPAL